MATLRDIKRRIVGVKSTQQITKAMKMVAAAKLRRAQENVLNARPYARQISHMLQHLLTIEKDFNSPFITPREVKRIGIVVVTSDRGLCGSFNMNLIREAMQLSKEQYADYMANNNLVFYCIGRKGLDFFARDNQQLAGKYSGIFSTLTNTIALQIMDDLKKRYLSGEFDKILVVYNEFKSVIQQKIVVEQLLPIPELKDIPVSTQSINFIFEPDKKEIINQLLPRHLNSQMWRILLESYAAELGARMTAMDMATENAKELIRTLQLKYNKERQAAITKEILEIVSGANALKRD